MRSLLVVLAVIAGACSSTDSHSADSTASTPADAVTTADHSTSEAVGAAGSSELGNTSVGIITKLSKLDVAWTRTALEVPDPAMPEAFLASVSVLGADVVAVAFGWKPAPENEVVYTWQSGDGLEWTVTTLDIPQGESMHRVVATGDQLIGFGVRSTGGSAVPVVYLWDRDDGWDPIDLSTSGLDLEGVEMVGAAGTTAGIVLGGRRDEYLPGLSSNTFEADGYEFEVNDVAGTYAVIDVETGRLVAGGQLSEIYRSSDEGQAIYDLESGQLIIVVPWEVWERQSVPTSPLPVPIPAPNDGSEPGQATIEWDGYEVMLDEQQDRFEVVEQAGGELVTSGSLLDLHRGPSPTFVDNETGEIIISFSWDEWYENISAASEAANEPHRPHPAQHVILFSADGRQWSEQTLESGANTHLEAVLSIRDQFLVTVAEHHESGTTRRVYVSADGLEWEEADDDVEGPESLYDPKSGSSGAIAVSDAQGTSAISISDDGRSWSTAFFLPPQDDGREGRLRLGASGSLGRAAVADLYPRPQSEILTTTVGSRTALFGGTESALQISDDTTGEVLLQLSWSDLEQAAEGTGPSYVTYADEATSFWTADGELLMTITDDEAFAALDDQAQRAEAGVTHVAFVELAGRWYEAELPDIGMQVPEQLAVGADAVVIGTNEYGDHEEGEIATNRIGLLIGRIGNAEPNQ